jgi:hypothetical protein
MPPLRKFDYVRVKSTDPDRPGQDGFVTMAQNEEGEVGLTFFAERHDVPMSNTERDLLSIKTLLDMMTRVEDEGRAIAAFLLEHGRHWVSAPLPKGMKAKTPKQCYSNAQSVVVEAAAARIDPGLTYVEGFACSGTVGGIIPIYHAWLVDGNGKVVDQTWKMPESSTYFGVALRSDYLVHRAIDAERYLPLIDSPSTKWELIRDRDAALAAIRPLTEWDRDPASTAPSLTP